MEYWAMVWGTILMGATGLLIWLKIPVTQYLPRRVVATTIHYYEALLGCLDGHISAEMQAHEHAFETVAEDPQRQGLDYR